MNIAGTVKSTLNELGFDDSKEKRDLILSMTVKIILCLGKKGEETFSEKDAPEITTEITKEEMSLLNNYKLNPPPLNALYAIINALLAGFNIEADNISREETTLKVRFINKK